MVLMEYRIDQLAAASGVSSDTIRYWQSRRLLPLPRREGRIAWYDEDHLERIARIRGMQQSGLTLAAIRRVIDGAMDRADLDLAAAVATARSRSDERLLSLEELAATCGMHTAILQSLINGGLELGRLVDGERRFGETDVAMVKLGLRLLDAGLPLTELLELAQQHIAAMRQTAERAVAIFDAHVRKPILERGGDDAAGRLVAAFDTLLPAATSLVAHHFRHMLLAVAEEHIAQVGDPAEIAAARAASRPRLEVIWSA